MEKQDVKRYLQFFLVVLAAGAIYPLVYLRTNYQETILQVFDMSIQQLNTLYSALGIAFVVGYLPSGLLSDKFSAKGLLVVSLLGTAAGGLWFAQIPSYSSVVMIFIIYGTFTVFTFWSSHMKLVKLLSKREEEGRFFGILDGGRGVVEAALASVAVFIFSLVLGNSQEVVDKEAALISVTYMYTIFLIVTAVLIWIFVKEDEKVETEESERFRLSDIPQILKNKYLYLHGAIVFFGYAVYWTVYYLGGYLESNIGVLPVTVGTVTVAILWMRPVGGFIGGFMADRFGKTNTIMTALAGAGVFLVLTAVLPASMGHGVFFAVVIVLAIFLYAIRGTYWSILGDDGYSNIVMGTAIGVISLIGYLPDIILPQFNSMLFNNFGDKGGYNAYFIASAGMAVAGIIFAFIYGRLQKKEGIGEAASEGATEAVVR